MKKKWLNDYHKTVYEKTAPYLTPEEAQWLAEKTNRYYDPASILLIFTNVHNGIVNIGKFISFFLIFFLSGTQPF